MKCYLALGLIFILSIKIALSAPVKGIVKNTHTNEELIGATVLVKGKTNKFCLSGLDGSFSLQIDEYPAILLCSYIGYTAQEVTIENDTHTTVNIQLAPDIKLMNEVVVTGNFINNTETGARSIEKNSLNIMNVVSAKAIEISPDMTVGNVISRVSGIIVERNNSGEGQYALLRGMDKRYNYTLVNGVKIPSPDNKNRFVPLDIFPSELLERLEVSKALTSDMEADGIGGAVNLIMKDAPISRQLTFNFGSGYNALFFDRPFSYFDHTAINKQAPDEIHEEKIKADIGDFTNKNLRLKSKTAPPNLLLGMSLGNRFFGNKLGLMLAGNYQNSYRGSNSLLYSFNSTSDLLPILSSEARREYSEQQSRMGSHLKLDYRINKNNKLQWYNGYMYLSSIQVRDNTSIPLLYGYAPEQNSYNMVFGTRLRMNKQSIFNSTLKGNHSFLNDDLKIDWSAVYSNALNKTPDNATINSGGIMTKGEMGPISVASGDGKGASRRWEHNSDQDLAGYLNLTYSRNINTSKLAFSIGGMHREKKRTSFFTEYTFSTYDESKPAKPSYMRTNLIKGEDWNNFDEIKFRVYTPYGSPGDPLNYDATESIGAGYLMAKFSKKKFQLITGVRIEHTNQGYNLKYPIEGMKNIGEQDYIDVLPSLHIKYEMKGHTNIRASYVKSINRPSFFEIVPYNIVNEDYTERGNPDLKHTVAHNFDLRYEYFPRNSEQLMVGLFYKKINDPIEMGTITEGQGSFYKPLNLGTAYNYGLEIDLIRYFNWLGIKTNYTFTKSNITTDKLTIIPNPDQTAPNPTLIINVSQDRPLNGQSMHVFNFSFLIKTATGWDGQLAFSYAGDHIYAVSRYLNDDIWRAGFVQFDASIEKKIKSGWSLFAKAANLLDTPMIQYIKKENSNNEKVASYVLYKKGTLLRKDYFGQNFIIGIRYKLQ